MQIGQTSPQSVPGWDGSNTEHAAAAAFFLSQVNFFDFDQLHSGADSVPAINGFFFALNVISQLVCANEANFEVDTLSSVSISKAFTCLIYGPSSLVKLNPAVKG